MKDNNKKSTRIFLMILTLVIAFTGGFFTHYITQPKSVRRLSEVISIINKKAKDPSGNDLDFNADDITKEFVEAVLVGDDYAEYYTKEEFNSELAEDSGSYTGVGISLYKKEPRLYTVLGNSPAEKAGLKENDYILRGKASGEDYVYFLSTDDVIAFIQAQEENKEFEFVVYRDGEEKAFNLVKRKYVRSYVYYYDNESSARFVSDDDEKPTLTPFENEKNTALPSDTAHIIFTAFEGDASKQLEEVLSYFYSKGKTKMIFDLRANGGGNMRILQDVASYFINNNGKQKNLVTEVQGRNNVLGFYSNGNNFNSQLQNIVVLANEGTASASECLIGAMLCYGDANFSMDNLLIEYNVENKNYSTYGKGIMQTTYPLLSGGALKLTTARIYWPDKTTCIHGTGIVQTNVANQITKENAITRAIEILG